MFRNGAPGSVHLELGNLPKIAGLSVKLDKADVNLGENVTVRIRYEPDPDPDSVPPPPHDGNSFDCGAIQSAANGCEVNWAR